MSRFWSDPLKIRHTDLMIAVSTSPDGSATVDAEIASVRGVASLPYTSNDTDADGPTYVEKAATRAKGAQRGTDTTACNFRETPNDGGFRGTQDYALRTLRLLDLHRGW